MDNFLTRVSALLFLVLLLPGVAVSSDLGGDGREDLVWRNEVTGTNWLYSMEGPVILSSQSINTVNADQWQLDSIGDFNGDSKSDLLWRHKTNGQLWIYLMDGAGIHRSEPVTVISDNDWRIAGTGDLDGDGSTDIVFRNSSSGTVWLYQMSGSQIVNSSAVTVVSDLRWTILGVEDFDADGRADIIWRNSETGQLWLYSMDGANIIASLPSATISDLDWKVVGIDDFDADGQADIVWRNTSTGEVWMYLMAGADIAVSQSIENVANLDWKVVKTGDLNGDGKADLVWRNKLTGQLWLYEMDGISLMSSETIISVGNLNWQVFDNLIPNFEPSGLNARPSNLECVAGDAPPSETNYTAAAAFPLLAPFTKPLSLLQAPGNSSFWYVVEQDGRIIRFQNLTSVSSKTEFLDISGPGGLVDVDSSAQESGLLGMAFHPDYGTDNFYVFLSYTIDVPGQSGIFTSQVARFESTDGGQTLDPATREVLLSVPQTSDVHNGGHLSFGPDGFLYANFGDGGPGGDPDNRAQRTTNLFGAVLRIGVDGASPYTIPSGNPFVGNPLCTSGASTVDCPEIFAWGFRNPWKSSFDAATGEFWLGDVGQNQYEEINRVEVGGNYGWRCREGAHDFDLSGSCPNGMIDPEIEYDHSIGRSVTGGYVYRGSGIQSLAGKYIFGDYVNGKIFASSSAAEGYELLIDTNYNISSFAEDEDGELLFVDYSGSILRIISGSTSGSGSIPDLLSETGCANAIDPTSPSSGLIPYEINTPFWSDGAEKGRWYSIPDGTTIDVDSDGDWLFPIGSVLRKDFWLVNELFETRLLMRHTNGEWRGYTYEWNGSGTDAFRVIGGKTKEVQGQTWTYPSESQCMDCHTQVANFSLGLEHGQLNRAQSFPSTGIVANQLDTAEQIGVLTTGLADEPANLPKLTDLTLSGPQAPMIQNPGDQISAINTAVYLSIAAFDLNGDALTFSAIGLPDGLTISQSGVLSGTPTQIGNFTVSVIADDGVTGSDSASFNWSIVATVSCNECIDFSTVTTSSFDTQDIDGQVLVQNAGASIRLDNNTWRGTDTFYQINGDSVLKFTYESTVEGEVQGIGFDEDNVLSEDRIFRVFGNQEFGIPGFGYSGSGPQDFVIPVGQYFTGASMRLVLANDDDAGLGSNSTFTNVRLINTTEFVARPNAPRSYLHSNCAGCHRPFGPTPSSMDLQFGTPFALTGTCDVAPSSGDLGVPNARLISPGNAAESIIVNRANRRDASGMPPLGSHLVDTEGVALLTGWIDGLSGCP